MAAGTVHVPSLVGLLVDLADASGAVIREVTRGGDLGVRDKGAIPTLDGALVADAQTEADRRVEALLLAALARAHAEVVVVGEESSEGEMDGEMREADVEAARRLVEGARSTEAELAASQEAGWPEALREPVDASRVVVYADPLDGTNEYAGGEREAVTVLMGVAVDGRPVAGVIHQPFHGYDARAAADGQTDERLAPLGRTVWGGPGVGVRGGGVRMEARVSAPPPLRACLQRNLRDARQEPCCEALQVEEACRISATGYHWLRVLEGSAHCNLMLRKASKKWDSCAGEALLVAAGGGVTDTVGRLYDYTHNPDAVQNLCGLVGFADRALGERVTRTIQETIAPLGDYPYDGARARAATRAFSRACAGVPGGGSVRWR